MVVGTAWLVGCILVVVEWNRTVSEDVRDLDYDPLGEGRVWGIALMGEEQGVQKQICFVSQPPPMGMVSSPSTLPLPSLLLACIPLRILHQPSWALE